MTTPRNPAAALHAITANCLAQVRSGAAALGEDDPETVHQMRVGLRRLRCALRLFAAAVPCPPRLPDELAWLAGRLGALRDWDVLIGTTLPGLAQQADTSLLRAAAMQIAQRRRLAARAAVASRRYARLMHTLDVWLDGLAAQMPRAARHGKRRMRHFAARLLQQHYRALRRRGRDTADAAQRHRVRIAAKRLRYAMEFFADLYPAHPGQRFIKKLARLQEVLGLLNDAAVADGLLARLGRLPGLGMDAAAARAALAAGTDAGVAQLRRRLRRLAPLPRS